MIVPSWKFFLGLGLFFASSFISESLSVLGYTFVFFGTDLVVYGCGALAGSMLMWGVLESPRKMFGGYLDKKKDKRLRS